MVTVSVSYGTGFARLLGTSGETVHLDTPTLAGLARAIKDIHGDAIAKLLGDPDIGDPFGGLSVLINGKSAAPGSRLADGDEIAILIVAAGG